MYLLTKNIWSQKIKTSWDIEVINHSKYFNLSEYWGVTLHFMLPVPVYLASVVFFRIPTTTRFYGKTETEV